MELSENSRVAIIGGGPAGSFAAYFILDLAHRLDFDMQVDIYEPKDFSHAGAKGCNHCGGIISESLVQFMSTEGIVIPPELIMNTIASYALHTDSGSVGIAAPLDEMRIAAIYRGGGPKIVKGEARLPNQSFDDFLLKLAIKKGANHIQDRVTSLTLVNGFPKVETKKKVSQVYDFLVGATGVNSTGLKLFEKLGIGYAPPPVSKTFIGEYLLGRATVEKYIGDAMHVFLLDIPGIKQAALIPKGPFASLCIVGQNVGMESVEQFHQHREVKSCFPPEWQRPKDVCHCLPKTVVGDPIQPFADRVALVGDCGVTRLYKDGIGSAYRTARACAATAVFQGISEELLKKFYWPACRSISRDNRIGHVVLSAVNLYRRVGFMRRGMLAMAEREQRLVGNKRPMSMTLWDTFTGSAPYGDILMRTMGPAFISRITWETTKGVFRSDPTPAS